VLILSAGVDEMRPWIEKMGFGSFAKASAVIVGVPQDTSKLQMPGDTQSLTSDQKGSSTRDRSDTSREHVWPSDHA
jgi:hypothetical protein